MDIIIYLISGLIIGSIIKAAVGKNNKNFDYRISRIEDKVKENSNNLDDKSLGTDPADADIENRNISNPKNVFEYVIPSRISINLPAIVKSELLEMPESKQYHFLEEYERKSKSTGTAYILWLLLGWHYAYFKKWGIQILLWITFAAYGLGLIWWLIDLFRVAGIARDYNKDVAIEVLKNMKAIKSN